MKLGIGEVFIKAAEAKSEDDRVSILSKNKSGVVSVLLRYALDPQIEWLLPENNPPYTPYTGLDSEGMLYQEVKRLYLFVRGGEKPSPLETHPQDNRKKAKQKQLQMEMHFINLLESLMPDDAKLLLMVKNKKLPPGISREAINLVYPELRAF